jgi:hypothetical protein
MLLEPLHPGGALQAPSSVVHTSSFAQLAVDAHGVPLLPAGRHSP